MNDPNKIIKYCRWLVFSLAVILLVMAFLPNMSFSVRCNFVTASVVDFGAVAFTYVWPKLHK